MNYQMSNIDTKLLRKPYLYLRVIAYWSYLFNYIGVQLPTIFFF